MIVGLASWRGLGATTTAMLVATRLAARGAEPWLIEADPAGGVLAARLDGLVPSGTLEEVAFPSRRGPASERFADAATRWGGVRVVPAPGDPFRAWACHHPRLAWASALRELDGPVVVDLGRLRGGGPVDHVLQQLDVLLLVATSDVVDLVASADWAAMRGRTAATEHSLAVDITRVVVVDAPDPAAPTSRTTAEVELGDRFAGWLPWAPAAVGLVRRQAAPGDRRLRRQPLVHAADHLVQRIATWTCPDVALAAPTQGVAP